MSVNVSTLEMLDTERFRQKLAGLVDPNPDSSTEPGRAELTEIRETASRFVCVLAHLFGDDLDRKTLWARIGSALETGCAKVTDDDLDRFASHCLAHVCAASGKAAACEPLTQILQTSNVRTPEWRFAFLHHIRTHAYAVLVHGRARWESVKKGTVDL